MRSISIALAVSLALSACSSGSSSSNADQKEARAKNAALRAEGAKTAQQVQVNGLTFSVYKVNGSYSDKVVLPGQENVPLAQKKTGVAFIDREWAAVTLVNPASAPYTVAQVETAARQATGCRAEFAAGVLAFVGGFGTATDLQTLDAKRSGRDKSWRTDLTC